MFSRRKFIATQSTALLGLSLIPQSLFSSPIKRKFRMSLNPGAIGVNVSQEKALEYAKSHGFEAMNCNSQELIQWDSAKRKAFKEKMDTHQISWGSAGLLLDFRKDASTYQMGLKALPKAAKAMEEAGANRMNTWIMPTQANRTYLENFKLHQKRIKEISNILGHHGIRFGLEYVGPKTLMSRDKFSFIRTMA
ncbi:MAG: TIM barrel protein, partial [Bacteroidota bacterium]